MLDWLRTLQTHAVAMGLSTVVELCSPHLKEPFLNSEFLIRFLSLSIITRRFILLSFVGVLEKLQKSRSVLKLLNSKFLFVITLINTAFLRSFFCQPYPRWVSAKINWYSIVNANRECSVIRFININSVNITKLLSLFRDSTYVVFV